VPDLVATRRFFLRALEDGPRPTEVSTDRAPAYPRVLDELLPATCHVLERHATNPVEVDHGRLEGPATADAGTPQAAFSACNQYWARIRPESTARTLRTRRRCPPEASDPRGLRRTHPRHLIRHHSGQCCPLSINATMPVVYISAVGVTSRGGKARRRSARVC
jgi:hypothetical protein